MDSALAWVGWIAEWFAKFIPRLVIVRSTHGGVRFRHGRTAIEMKPGLHIYWPIVTEVEVIPVARQTHNLPSQSLQTKDGRKVVVGGVVIYAIRDVVAALSRNWDVSDTLTDITLVAVTHVVTAHDLAYLQEHLVGDVQAKLTRETRKKLSQYGVKVFRTALTDFSECLVIKNIGGGRNNVLIHNAD